MTSVAYTTYYSISGFSYDYKDTEDHEDDYGVSFHPSVTFNISGEPGSGFSYVVTGYSDGYPVFDTTLSSGTYTLDLDGHNLYALDVDASVIAIDWTMGGVSHSTTLLELDWGKGDDAEGYYHGTRYYFVLGGDELPAFSSMAEFDAFANSDTYITADYVPSTGPFAEGKLIEWGEILSTTVLGADEDISGTAGPDVLSGGYGDDYFISSEGNDTYKGGVGFDQVSFKDDPAGVAANLATGTATDGWGDTDTLISIEMLRGSLFDDTLIGDKGGNHIRGLGGDDVLNGGKGKDVVRYDRDAKYGGTDGVTVNLKKGTATDGFGDSDKLKNFENVIGTESKDKIIGSGGKNIIEGDGGNDVLKGLAGKDILFGGTGKDKLDGGNGNDKLYGDGGADRFIFSGKFGDDTIFDFDTAGTKERIDLSSVSPIRNFRDLSNNHLSEVSGSAVIDDGNGNTITLDGVAMSDLSANDFLF